MKNVPPHSKTLKKETVFRTEGIEKTTHKKTRKHTCLQFMVTETLYIQTN